MEIRKVVAEDNFDALGNIYASSWKAAYKGIVPQDYLDKLDGKRWSFILSNSEYDAYVLIENEQYIGTSSIFRARDNTMLGWGEIVAIYLLPEYFQKGYGQPLFEFSIKELEHQGFKDIYLWVLEDNTRARKFYEKCGFTFNGDTINVTIGGKELKEIRYIKSL